MEAEYKVEEQVLTIYLPKELDHHVADKIRRESEVFLEERQIRKVIFDFSDTVFMDSSGIGMVLGRVKRLRLLGGSVEACQVGNSVYRILNMSGLERVISIKRRETTWEK